MWFCYEFIQVFCNSNRRGRASQHSRWVWDDESRLLSHLWNHKFTREHKLMKNGEEDDDCLIVTSFICTNFFLFCLTATRVRVCAIVPIRYLLQTLNSLCTVCNNTHTHTQSIFVCISLLLLWVDMPRPIPEEYRHNVNDFMSLFRFIFFFPTVFSVFALFAQPQLQPKLKRRQKK